jgi:hypothetical protein
LGQGQSDSQREHRQTLRGVGRIEHGVLDGHRKHQASLGGKPPVCSSAYPCGLLVGHGDAGQQDLTCFDLPIEVPIGRVDLIEPLDASKKFELLDRFQS